MIDRVAAALSHAGNLEESVRDELKSFIAPEEDSRAALVRALESTCARHGTACGGAAGLGEGLDTGPRSCAEYQDRIDALAESLGWPIVDEALLRASAVFGLFLDESGTGLAFTGPLSAGDAAKILG